VIFNQIKSINQPVALPSKFGVELHMKREDRIHDFVSGNKYRKLKYNITEAINTGFDTLLTFGGAYSNHIAAVAFAAKSYGLASIGVIRGEELEAKSGDNPTLKFAKSCGMKLKFVSRSEYRMKTTEAFILQLVKEFGTFYLIPEGGTNALAIKGCEEILTTEDAQFDHICCAVGTGGTMAGLINASGANQLILGFPALKGAFLKDNISKFVTRKNWELIHDYHFGGYAKINPELVAFINQFKKDHGIPLDPVYTGKMMYGILDMIKNDRFPKGAKILAIHTGGLQGIAGINMTLKAKRLPLIN
jgi:1-aminocyclopropane-1-carboxylate deaminase